MPTRSFELVDDKCFEADFFLEKFAGSGFNIPEARFYLSAFLSASRSVTFALQAVMADVEGFAEWYLQWREKLQKNKIAKYFHKARTISQHIGSNPLNSGFFAIDPDGKRRTSYFSLADTEFDELTSDLVSAARDYLTLLLEMIRDSYAYFGKIINPEQYYTLENLRSIKRSIEDVEEELGFPRGWTYVEGCSEQDRMTALRQGIAGSSIGFLFEKYLKTNDNSKSGGQSTNGDKE